MRKWILVFLILGFASVNAQFFQHLETEETSVASDAVKNQKNTNYERERKFDENLAEKYNGKEFTYTEEEYEAPKKAITPSPVWSYIAQIIANFMRYVFPFSIGWLYHLFGVKSCFRFRTQLVFNQKKGNKQKEKLVYEEEADIENENLEELLQNAINSENFRLAIRFYFLIVLKELSQQKLIDYHKDKTNTEYLFELKNATQKEQFSYLLYLYNYIWYGEFAITKTEFQLAENEYQSFKKALL